MDREHWVALSRCSAGGWSCLRGNRRRPAHVAVAAPSRLPFDVSAHYASWPVWDLRSLALSYWMRERAILLRSSQQRTIDPGGQHVEMAESYRTGRGLREGNRANMSTQPIGYAKALCPLNVCCWRSNSGEGDACPTLQRLLISLAETTRRAFRFRLVRNVFGFSINSTAEVRSTSSHASFGCTASSTAMRSSARSTLISSVRSAAHRVRPPRWKPCAACIGAWGGQVRHG